MTLRLRELGGLVRIAGDLAISEGARLTEAAHVQRARGLALSVEEQLEATTPTPRPNLRTIVLSPPLPAPGGTEAGGGG